MLDGMAVYIALDNVLRREGWQKGLGNICIAEE